MLPRLLVSSLLCAGAIAQIPCFDPTPGTPVPLADDAFSAPVSFGFGFVFAGVTYTDCQICSNGYLVLGSGAPGYADWSPTVNELLTRPQARICPMWRDLDPGSGGQVSYRATPASGGDPARFTVTWDSVPVSGTAAVNTFQVVLFDGGEIQVHHDANTVDGNGIWVIGQAPGNSAPSTWVSFDALPFDTGTLTAMHEAALGGPTFGRSTMRWAPNGNGGYQVFAAPGCATTESYGEGCGMRFSSFYEHFPTAGGFDLSGQAISGLSDGVGYVVTTGLTQFVTPSASAIDLALTDDSVATYLLPAPLQYPGGVATSLTICSNGFVSVGNLFPSYDPHVPTMLSWPYATWTCWRDFEPTPSDNVLVETVGNIVYVTWDAVPSFNSTQRNTFQFQFDLATGDFHVVWLLMDTVGGVSTSDDYLVGFTTGNGAADPGNVDLTPVVAGLDVLATTSMDLLPLQLDASAAPIPATQLDLITGNLSRTALVGAVLFGLQRFDPGVDLSAVGMPGCHQYHDAQVSIAFVAGGAPTVTTTVTVPNAIGMRMQAQSAVLDPFAGLTPLGVVSSNALEFLIGL